MCGIAGFISNSLVDFKGASKLILEKMMTPLIPRGPDAHGFYISESESIAMVHRRLSILELSEAGSQPMYSEDKRFIIAFNGEIYNHNKLRLDIESSQACIKWRGNSDTETLLKFIELYGVQEALKSIVGMFSFALWDSFDKTLTLARDRMGEKPLYWGWQGCSLLFGSELKALKQHPEFVGDINRNALALLMRHNYIPAPHSIYEGIYKLQAGHYVTIRIGSRQADMNPKPYWRMNDAVKSGLANPFSGSDSEAVNLLEAQLIDSVGLQMLADVPLGAFLSGGVDSSTVVAIMQMQSHRSVRTFAIGFNEPGFNEAEHAKAVALHLGTEHTELYVGATEALALVPKLPTIYCEPFADSSQIPTFLVSQMARHQVTVALSGDGGDELFGGYNPYQLVPHLWNGMGWMSPPVRKFFQSALTPLPLPARLSKLREVMAARTPQELYRQVQSHWPNPESLVLDSKEPSTLLSMPEAWPVVDNLEHWMMAMDAQTYMVDDVLTKVDRAAMANSLETRVPLLDHRVVELAWRMPMNMKIRNGQGKWVLRQVLYRHVPREMIERPKKGFSIPLAAWLRGPLRDWAEALLNERRLKTEGYFNAAPIRRAWLAHVQEKEDYSTRLWGVLMFQSWLEEQANA